MVLPLWPRRSGYDALYGSDRRPGSPQLRCRRLQWWRHSSGISWACAPPGLPGEIAPVVVLRPPVGRRRSDSRKLEAVPHLSPAGHAEGRGTCWRLAQSRIKLFFCTQHRSHCWWELCFQAQSGLCAKHGLVGGPPDARMNLRKEHHHPWLSKVKRVCGEPSHL